MLQAIGLCRFSYPALGGFQVEHETIEDRIAYLYAEKRLQERFALFEHVALPCLRAQTDPNFEIIIVVGDSLPDMHLTRLLDLIEDMPQLSVQAHPPLPHRQGMRDILNDARHDRSEPCLQFRFDDDDAIGVDFITRLREAATDAKPLTAKHKMVAFDFHQGWTAEFTGQGISATQTYRPMFTAALAVQVAGGNGQSIMNFGHEKMGRFMPVVSYGDTPMWVRSHNDFNDSRQKANAKPVRVKPLDDAQRALFQDRFAIDENAIKTAFSAL
ncbi:putative rhamnosyl transferase [Ascidiaceihabitans sp.]|uniref:putative rhamnosyl transferase n=1 Tax=Ascidiaceihabitans sp. TaxID=1872644 RepID=UPI003296B6A4